MTNQLVIKTLLICFVLGIYSCSEKFDIDIYICLNILQNNKDYLKEVQTQFSDRYKFQSVEGAQEKQQNLENQIYLHVLWACQKRLVDMKNTQKLDILLNLIHQRNVKESKEYLKIGDQSIQAILSSNPELQYLLKQIQQNKKDELHNNISDFNIKNYQAPNFKKSLSFLFKLQNAWPLFVGICALASLIIFQIIQKRRAISTIC